MNKTLLIAILLTAILSACGGGEAEPEQPAPRVTGQQYSYEI